MPSAVPRALPPFASRNAARLLAGALLGLLLLAPQGAAAQGCRMPADQAQLAAQVVTLVNAERRKLGLRALQRSDRLEQAARRQACELAAARRLDHTARDGSTLRDRIRDTGYRPRSGSENIGQGFGSAEVAVAGWMRSAGHRQNFLDPEMKEVGIGIAESNTLYWAAVMGNPR